MKRNRQENAIEEDGSDGAQDQPHAQPTEDEEYGSEEDEESRENDKNRAQEEEENEKEEEDDNDEGEGEDEEEDEETGLVQCWDEAVTVSEALIQDAQLLWDTYGGDHKVARSVWFDHPTDENNDNDDDNNNDPHRSCLLQDVALQIANFHLQGVDYAGVEMWTQFRPMVPSTDGTSEKGGITTTTPTKPTNNAGLPFHFDKDEEALKQQNQWKHPVVATATYLTTGGAPLVIFATANPEDGGGQESHDETTTTATPSSSSVAAIVAAADPMSRHTQGLVTKKPRTNELSDPPTADPLDGNYHHGGTCDADDDDERIGPSHAWICYPKKGRHVAFAGNLLHGVAQELVSTKAHADRLSLLVNVWLDHRPLGVQTLSDHVLAKMHPPSPQETAILLGNDQVDDNKQGIHENWRQRQQPMTPLELTPQEPLTTLAEHVSGETAALPMELIRRQVVKAIVPPLIQITFSKES